MLVTLDDNAVQHAAFAPGMLLQELVDLVREWHARGRLIVSVAVNGRQIEPSDLSDMLQRPVAESDQIRFETGDPRNLVQSAFEELSTAFGEARWQHGALADKLAAGQADVAVRDLGGYLELWSTCRQALLQCSSLLDRDLTGHEYHGLPLESYLQNAVNVLKQVRDALEARDYVSLGDLVRYELPMLSETWQNIFEDLRASTDADAA